MNCKCKKCKELHTRCGVLHERSRKTIGFGGKRLPGNLKHNGQKGAKGRQLPNRAGRRFSSYRGRWGWAATFGAGMCGEEDSSAVRRRNDKTMGLRVYRLQRWGYESIPPADLCQVLDIQEFAASQKSGPCGGTDVREHFVWFLTSLTSVEYDRTLISCDIRRNTKRATTRRFSPWPLARSGSAAGTAAASARL